MKLQNIILIDFLLHRLNLKLLRYIVKHLRSKIFKMQSFHLKKLSNNHILKIIKD